MPAKMPLSMLLTLATETRIRAQQLAIDAMVSQWRASAAIAKAEALHRVSREAQFQVTAQQWHLSVAGDAAD